MVSYSITITKVTKHLSDAKAVSIGAISEAQMVGIVSAFKELRDEALTSLKFGRGVLLTHLTALMLEALKPEPSQEDLEQTLGM